VSFDDLQAFKLVTTAEWLNGSAPSRAKPANRAAQQRLPGVDAITVNQAYQFSTRRPVSASSTAAEFLASIRDASPESSRHAKRPTSATIPGSIAMATRSGSGYGGEQVRLDAAFANVACEAKATLGLFDVQPNVPPGLGGSRGL